MADAGSQETDRGTAEKPDAGQHPPPHLHIFVNRRKFEEGDGVREEMTGAQIAALVNVPKENAVVRRETGPDQGEIGVDQTIRITNGEHFLVTRRVVEGGHGAEPRAD